MTDLERFPDAVPAAWSSGSPVEAVAGAAFVSGPQWGDLDGTLAVAALRGEKLLLMTIGADGAVASVAEPGELDGTFGRLRAVRTAPGRRAVRVDVQRRRRQGAADRPGVRRARFRPHDQVGGPCGAYRAASRALGTPARSADACAVPTRSAKSGVESGAADIRPGRRDHARSAPRRGPAPWPPPPRGSSAARWSPARRGGAAWRRRPPRRPGRTRRRWPATAAEPLSLRTYCSAASCTSASVAGGAKLCRGRMLRHMRPR